MDSYMAMECGSVLKGNDILANGEIIRQMVMVFIFGTMEISMKENSSNSLKMDMVLKNLQMEMYIREII
jgi:hypothetical protein